MLDHVDQQALAKGHEITGGMAGARNSRKQHKSIMLSCSCLVSGLDVGPIKILTEMKEGPNPQYPAFPKIYILSILYIYLYYLCIQFANEYVNSDILHHTFQSGGTSDNETFPARTSTTIRRSPDLP